MTTNPTTRSVLGKSAVAVVPTRNPEPVVIRTWLVNAAGDVITDPTAALTSEIKRFEFSAGEGVRRLRIKLLAGESDIKGIAVSVNGATVAEDAQVMSVTDGADTDAQGFFDSPDQWLEVQLTDAPITSVAVGAIPYSTASTYDAIFVIECYSPEDNAV
jgi:hypothetical protein